MKHSSATKRTTSKTPSIANSTPKKLWTIAKADKEFSIYIRKRDKKCLFPGCTQRDFKKLQCSHYIGRAHKATRFDPENCITLCMYHHFMSRLYGFEYQKQTVEAQGYDGQYTLFMKKWLGQERFQALTYRGRQTMNQGLAILEVMALLGHA